MYAVGTAASLCSCHREYLAECSAGCVGDALPPSMRCGPMSDDICKIGGSVVLQRLMRQFPLRAADSNGNPHASSALNLIGGVSPCAPNRRSLCSALHRSRPMSPRRTNAHRPPRTIVRVHPGFTGGFSRSDRRPAQSAPGKPNPISGEPAFAPNLAATMERVGRRLAAGDDDTRVPDDRRNGLWWGANSSTL